MSISTDSVMLTDVWCCNHSGQIPLHNE